MSETKEPYVVQSGLLIVLQQLTSKQCSGLGFKQETQPNFENCFNLVKYKIRNEIESKIEFFKILSRNFPFFVSVWLYIDV